MSRSEVNRGYVRAAMSFIGWLDADTELRRRVRALHEIAVDFLGDEEARDLFCSVTKRGHGKRGPGRNPAPQPTKEAERKRRARLGIISMKLGRELTEEDLRRYNQHYIDRMNSIADKK
jgi:hypothetical protein